VLLHNIDPLAPKIGTPVLNGTFDSADILHIMHECTLCNPNDGKFSIQSAFNVLTDWD
jgi:hypothetical protein